MEAQDLVSAENGRIEYFFRYKYLYKISSTKYCDTWSNSNQINTSNISNIEEYSKKMCVIFFHESRAEKI